LFLPLWLLGFATPAEPPPNGWLHAQKIPVKLAETKKRRNRKSPGDGAAPLGTAAGNSQRRKIGISVANHRQAFPGYTVTEIASRSLANE
jgi:hypothetical protein